MCLVFRVFDVWCGKVDAHDTKTYNDFDGGRTPLHYAAHYGRLAHVQALVGLGAELRVMSNVGWPALFYAVENSKRKPGQKAIEDNWHLPLVPLVLLLFFQVTSCFGSVASITIFAHVASITSFARVASITSFARVASITNFGSVASFTNSKRKPGQKAANKDN
jgi:hypothetical protein